MTRFVGRLLVCLVVFAFTAILLMNTGRWNDVVGFVGDAFGQEAKEGVSRFGEASDRAGKDVIVWVEDARDKLENGEPVPVDWSFLQDAVDAFTPPSLERHPEYRRAEFGDGWLDTDGNGCDTRNDILQRDLVDETLEGSCKVLTGTLHDTYSGETIAFVRGEKTSAEVQIDHIVPLKLAWDAGAWEWPREKREQFANDPANLVAVKGSENTSKGAKGISQWLPSDPASWCTYTANYVTVHVKYDLPMSTADQDAADELIAACAD